MRWLMVLALALSVSGCSVIAVRGPHTTPTGAKVCYASYVPPVIDTAIALAGLALIVYSVTDPSSNNPETDGHTLTEREAAIFPGLLMGLPFGVSAAHGYSKVGKCKAAATASTTTAGK